MVVEGARLCRRASSTFARDDSDKTSGVWGSIIASGAGIGPVWRVLRSGCEVGAACGSDEGIVEFGELLKLEGFRSVTCGSEKGAGVTVIPFEE